MQQVAQQACLHVAPKHNEIIPFSVLYHHLQATWTIRVIAALSMSS